MVLVAENAKVYRAENGRRYLAKSAAYRATAYARIRRFHPESFAKSYPGDDEVGYCNPAPCRGGWDELDSLIGRYASMLERRDRKEQEH